MTVHGPKPKKAVLVTPFRHIGEDGRPYWQWPGAPDTGIEHTFRLDGPLEQVVWELRLGGYLLASTTLFSRGRSEAEHYLAWWRHWGLDANGANRLLRESGHFATQHVDMESCLCDGCVETREWREQQSA
jgi:hypothetical protein